MKTDEQLMADRDFAELRRRHEHRAINFADGFIGPCPAVRAEFIDALFQAIETGPFDGQYAVNSITGERCFLPWFYSLTMPTMWPILIRRERAGEIELTNRDSWPVGVNSITGRIGKLRERFPNEEIEVLHKQATAEYHAA